MEERSPTQKLLAEFVGSFTLVFIAAGAVIATAQEPTAGLITIGLAYGLAVATMVGALAHVSGAHFNPAVTIGAWVTQKIGGRDASTYIVAQIAGAAAAAGVLRVAIPERLWRLVNLGTPEVTAGIDTGQAVLIEAVLTFFLVWVIFATIIDPDGAFRQTGGLSIGFAVTMGVMMGSPFTGGAMNPARWFGPAIVGGFTTNAWVYLVGPIAGGIVAAVLYDIVIMKNKAATEPEEAPVDA